MTQHIASVTANFQEYEERFQRVKDDEGELINLITDFERENFYDKLRSLAVGLDNLRNDPETAKQGLYEAIEGLNTQLEHEFDRWASLKSKFDEQRTWLEVLREREQMKKKQRTNTAFDDLHDLLPALGIKLNLYI